MANEKNEAKAKAAAAAKAAKEAAAKAKEAAKVKAEEAKEAAAAKKAEKEAAAEARAAAKAEKDANKEAEAAKRKEQQEAAAKKRELNKTIGKVFRSFIARIKYMLYMDQPSAGIEGIENLEWTLSYVNTDGVTYTVKRGSEPGMIEYTVKKGTKVVDSGEVEGTDEELVALDWAM